MPANPVMKEPQAEGSPCSPINNVQNLFSQIDRTRRPLEISFNHDRLLTDFVNGLCTDGFNTAVHSYESLLSLARSQGAVGGQNRGACKVCGQLGHLTKQCRNMQSAFFKPAAEANGAAGANGKGLTPAALEAARANLLVLPDGGSELESEISDSDSSSRPLVLPVWPFGNTVDHQRYRASVSAKRLLGCLRGMVDGLIEQPDACC